MIFTGAKACYRTALEICKLLLSLDFENDPLGAILVIDLFALRSNQHKYLIEFHTKYANKKFLNLLPNFSYSVALANYCLFKETNCSKFENEADNLIKSALIKFPALLMELLDKCGIQPDKVVEKHWIFSKTSHLSVPIGLKCLIDIYTSRIFHEWKLSDVIGWVEKNVKSIIQEESLHEKTIRDYKNQFKVLFAKAPSNVLRHMLICDSKEVPLSLPRVNLFYLIVYFKNGFGLLEFSSNKEYHMKAIYTFDPIPPENSIVSYKRPDKPRTIAPYANEPSLVTFFRSLLPSFNSDV